MPSNENESGRKTINNVAIVFFTNIFNEAVRFIVKITLARILLPADFGLVALALFATKTLGLFRGTAFIKALIYKRDNIDLTSNTVFIIEVFIGLALLSITYLLAPLAAIFFNNLELTHIIKIFAFLFLIESLGSTSSAMMEKKLDFKSAVIPGIISTIIYAVTAIPLALWGFGFLSLVYGRVLSALGGLVSIWHISSWKPRFVFDKLVAKEVFSYAKHIIGATLVIFLVTNLDDAIIGKVLGAKALGFYTMAFLVARLPAVEITHVINRVMFPTYSKLQDDIGKLKDTYLKTLKYSSLLLIPASFGVFLFAAEFVEIFLTQKWLPSVIPMQILACYGLFTALSGTTGQVFLAVGKPKILTNLSLAQLIILLIFFYPAVKYGGIIGMSILATFCVGVGLILSFKEIIKILGINLNIIFINMRTQFISVGAATIVFLSLKYAVNIQCRGFFPAFNFIVNILFYLSVYALMVTLLDKSIVKNFINIFKSMLSGRTKEKAEN